MPRTTETEVLISAKTKGFAQARQESARIARENSKAVEEQIKGFDRTGKGMKAVDKEVKRLEGSLQDLAKQQAAINAVMAGVADKAAPAYKELAKELKGVDEQAQRIERTMRTLDRAFARQKEQSQGFSQGLLQGAAPGAMTFLQRGPGMKRQAMGAALGSGARRTLGAAGTSLRGGMFSGAQGLIGGLQGLPIVGGMLAAPMQRAMEQAQQSMQAKQVQLQTMPFLGGVGLQMRGAQAARKASKAAEAQYLEANLGTPEMQKQVRIQQHNLKLSRAKQIAGTHDFQKTGGFLENLEGFGGEKPIDRIKREMKARSEVNKDVELDKRTREIVQQDVEMKVRQRGEGAGRKAGGRARSRAMRQALGIGSGWKYGMDINAERQLRAGVQQAGGGFGITGQERTMGTTAMAAQTAFGVGGDVSGAFLQAGRRGGLEGASGGASRMLTDSLADAMKLGLEGSEINAYLQQMASGITAWKTTGIPFNKASMADIAGTLGTMGMGGVRGMAVAGGVSRAAEQLSRTGPQSVGQLMMLQTLGGMTPGKTGMESMEEALIRLEKKDFKGEDLKRLVEGLMRAGGGGAEGRRVAYGTLQQAGIQISREELKAIDEGADPATLQKIREQQATGGKLAKRTASSPAALARAAQDAVPNALKRQAALTNAQIRNGENLVGTMKTLEETAQRMTKIITEALAPILEKMGIELSDVSKAVERTVDASKAAPAAVETGPS